MKGKQMTREQIQSQQTNLMSLEHDRAQLQSLLGKNQAVLETGTLEAKLEAKSRAEAAKASVVQESHAL